MPIRRSTASWCNCRLPAHIDSGRVIQTIAPEKDVDGFHFINVGKLGTGELETAFVPCTPAGSMLLIERVRGKDLSGLNAVVVGRSNIVGKPMANLLLAANCTVTIAHSRTKDLPALARTADILVAAVGRPEMVKGDWVKPGATVIDVGINRVPAPEKGEGKTRLVGDVAYQDAAESRRRHHAGAGRRRPDDHRHADGQHRGFGLSCRRAKAARILSKLPAVKPHRPALPLPPVPVEGPFMSDQIQGGRQFAFLLVDKFSMFSLAAAIDTFRSANRLLGRDFYGWTTVSADGDPVMASNGLPLKIDYAVADIPHGRHPVRFGRPDHRIPGQEQGAGGASKLGPARRQAWRAVGRLVSARRGRAARRLPLHHPLGKPRRLHGALPRNRLHRQRLRDRPQALYLRRRHHLDRPDAGDRAFAISARTSPTPSPTSSSTSASARPATASASARSATSPASRRSCARSSS